MSQGYMIDRMYTIYKKRMPWLSGNRTVEKSINLSTREMKQEPDRLPRVRWRQPESHKLPFYLYDLPTNFGYFTTGLKLHYLLNQYQGVLWLRMRHKRITKRYMQHLCREMGYYLK